MMGAWIGKDSEALEQQLLVGGFGQDRPPFIARHVDGHELPEPSGLGRALLATGDGVEGFGTQAHDFNAVRVGTTPRACAA